MNTGMQDAANLAWKLALVWKGASDASLLETYQEERHPVGEAVLRASGRMLRAASSTNVFVRHLRDLVLHVGLEIPAVRKHLRDFLTEETIHYRKSRLNGPGIRGASVQPGDAFPDVAIGDGSEATPATNLLRDAEAAVLVLGEIDTSQLPSHIGRDERNIPITVRRVGPGTDLPDASALLEALGLVEQGVVVVRPDSVVAAVGEDVDATADVIRTY